MKQYWQVLKVVLTSRISRQMMYRFSFWTAAFVDGSLFLIQLLTFNAIFSQVESIGGWQRGHMAIFVGTFTILDAFYMGTYFFGVLNLPEFIRNGQLDLYLVKPVNPLFLISTESMDLGSIILSIPGMGMVMWGAAQLQLPLNPLWILGYIGMLLLMYVLMYCLMVLMRIPAFWLVKLTVFSNLENAMVEFSYRVPGVMFKGIWKFILYILLPYGLMATLPTQILAGESRWTAWLLAGGVLAGFWYLMDRLWHQGLRQYNSASS
jgi:ABC-2 type transport system permease protein